MSARSEHRYIANSLSKARLNNQRTAEIESLHFSRSKPLSYAQQSSKQPDKRTVLRWMLANRTEYNTATELAESAAIAFDFGSTDPLSDETHWIWEIAIEALPGD